jgi:hypothetical protein
MLADMIIMKMKKFGQVVDKKKILTFLDEMHEHMARTDKN